MTKRVMDMLEMAVIKGRRGIMTVRLWFHGMY